MQLLSETISDDQTNTEYEVGVYIGEEIMAIGTSSTRKRAEKIAAEKAIEMYLLRDHYFLTSGDQLVSPRDGNKGSESTNTNNSNTSNDGKNNIERNSI